MGNQHTTRDHAPGGPAPGGGGPGPGGGGPASSDAATFQVRVMEGGKEHPRTLHYVDPTGNPVWCSKEQDYLSQLDSFEHAQRVCRQIMIEPKFAPGTRVQFFKGGRRVKHSTVLKP